MNSNIRHILIPVVIALLISCSPSLYLPKEEDVSLTGYSLDTLLMGRKLYINKCSSCHNLFLPQQFNKEDWENILSEMKESAKINDQETNSIKIYLQSGAKK